MKYPLPFVSVAIAALSLLSLAALADDKKATVDAKDETRIKEMVEAVKIQNAISELAVRKANKADVKDLAQTMVTDHTALFEGLERLSQSKGIQLSAVIDPSGAAKFRELETFSGKPFDEAYITRVASGQRRLVDAFEEATKDASDADLKAFANKMLPTLRAHLEKVGKMIPENTPPTPLPPI